MDVPEPYTIERRAVGLVLGMTRYNYHIMYYDQPVATLFAPGVAKTVCDAMNMSYRAGYYDGAADNVLQRRLSK